MDIHIRSNSGLFQSGTSNPSIIALTPGGVARNICENLGHLGVRVRLLGAVGEDEFSEAVLRPTAAAGVETEGVEIREGERTGTYVTLVESGGSVHTAASDMTIMSSLDAAWIEGHDSLVRDSTMVIADTNLPAESLSRLVTLCNDHEVPVLIDPVSVDKASRLSSIHGKVDFLTPDLAEWESICAGAWLTPAHSIVTLGADGARWTDHESGESTTFAAKRVRAVDTTGAGDAFVSGLVAGLVRDRDLHGAIAFATEVASTVVLATGCTLSAAQGDRLRAML